MDNKDRDFQKKIREERIIDRLAATLVLDESVRRVHSVSPARARILEKKGIKTVRDLLSNFPHRYIDMSQVQTISTAVLGERCTIIGTIYDIKLKQVKTYLSLVEITLTDASGMMVITCFRQPWLMNTLATGMRVAVSGKAEFDYGYQRMTNPFIEVIEGEANEEEGVIIPVHPSMEKISSSWMRRLVRNALEACKGLYDPLPLDLRVRYLLPSKQAALSSLHFPHAMDEVTKARRRLVYEEVLLLELYLMSEAAKRAQGKTPTVHEIKGTRLCSLRDNLPFTLTDEQVAATQDILAGMAKNTPLNHMVLGDVGTGKTIVAAFALAACADTRRQACMMAPTEILARQYGEKLGKLFDQAGITWGVLTGSSSLKEREALLEGAAKGDLDVLFGTHALLEKEVVFKHCTLVVIDEQHRFGVKQRSALLSKGEAPDALYLTATPIPRTLALALYGDLSLSYLKYRPRNTAGNITKVYPKSQRGQAYDAALAALKEGNQVYVVCPLVGKKSSLPDEKEKKDEYADSSYDEGVYTSVNIEDEDDLEHDNVKAALQEAAFLQNKTFVDYQVDLLHGKMSGAEKQEAMRRFRAGETQVLVATTVIEVGVDVPNATVMIVEDADRFGLAQLHQLRGRVGRGEVSGEIFLISGSKAPLALERLEAMEKTEDGFELASYDLSLRREGDILGNRQHGSSALKLVNVVRDGKIIEIAHADAKMILEIDPLLEGETYRSLGREMRIIFRNAQKAEGG